MIERPTAPTATEAELDWQDIEPAPGGLIRSTALFKRLAAGRAREEYLLRRGDGQPWARSNQGPPMREACRRAKINPPVGFHQLRHTWASHAVMNGMPLMVVARNLGHRDTKMVEAFYGHLSEDYIDQAIKAGAPRFGGVRPGKVRALR